MFALLKRVLGTSEAHKEAEERYKKHLEELEKREEELDALGAQLKKVSDMQAEKNKNLTETMSKTLSFPPTSDQADEQEDEERPSGEQSPVSV